MFMIGFRRLICRFPNWADNQPYWKPKMSVLLLIYYGWKYCSAVFKGPLIPYQYFILSVAHSIFNNSLTTVDLPTTLQFIFASLNFASAEQSTVMPVRPKALDLFMRFFIFGFCLIPVPAGPVNTTDNLTTLENARLTLRSQLYRNLASMLKSCSRTN